MKKSLLISITATLISFANFASADNLEIALTAELDTTTNAYCFDIMGGGENVDPSRGLQAHTCFSYKGELGPDQAVTPASIENGQFYIAGFDVCVTMAGLEEGSSVALTSCDENNKMQMFDFVQNGNISPKAAPDMCVTIGDETSHGRAIRHQIRTLSLEKCSDTLSPRQHWYSRTQATYDASL